MAQQQQDKQGGRSIEVKTLILAAAGAATAAIVTSFFWKKGTLISTALTPVIVALTQEALRRPAEKISATASKVTVAPTRGVAAAAGVGTRRSGDGDRFDERRLLDRERAGSEGPTAYREGNGGEPTNGIGPPPAVAPPPPLDDTRAYDPARSAGAAAVGNGQAGPGDTAPAAAAGAGPEPTVYGRRRFRWKVAILTGLAAFAIVAVVLTASELALGGSVGGDGRTSLFGGDGGAERSDGGDGDEASEDSSDPSSEGSVPSDSSESQAVPPEDGGDVAPPEEEPAPEEQVEPTEPLPSEPAPAE